MDSLTIAYGRKAGPRSGHIREGRRGVADPRFTVRANETPPIRLNTDHGLRFPPDQLSLLPTNHDKLEYLRQEIVGSLDMFAQYQRSFLDRYFAFIVDRCRDAAAVLGKGLEWSGGLLCAEDFVFSALWPLPDATVIISTDADDQALGDFDFAFWSGRRIVAVTLPRNSGRRDGSGDLDGRALSDLILPVTIAAKELDEPDLFSEPRFPADFVSYWIGEGVPSSPFRPEGLTTPSYGTQ
jgi:hypothetical protein